MAVGHVGRIQGGESWLPEASVPRERTPSFRSLSILNFPVLAVATPTLANDLFPGVTDRKVPSLCHPDLTGQSFILPLSVPSPRICGGQTWKVINCSFLAQGHAYIIWPSLAPFLLLTTGFITMVSQQLYF
uniref:Uncharacterized protein n=1 Tax=Myotis myotis TaxID=51298 RepID=A0A7J7UPY6_MYOMY|nr:hypothetical protein mMyoMyo1_008631 [Myotis myotis]